MAGQHLIEADARAAKESVLVGDRVHQPGIGFPAATAQRHLLIVRIDLAAGGDLARRRLLVQEGLARLCGLFARIADGTVTMDVPGDHGLVTRALTHWQFTATVAFGPGFFEGLAIPVEKRPRRIRPMPSAEALGDRAPYSMGQTDMLVQLGATDDFINRFVLENALGADDDGKPLDIMHALAGWATVADAHAGFQRVDGRNLQGFLDGTSNPRRLSPLFDRLVWTTFDDEPLALVNGSYLVFQKIVHDLDQWRVIDLDEQQEWVGRTRGTGLLLGTLSEEDDDALFAAMHSADDKTRTAARARWQALIDAQSDPEARLYDRVPANGDIPNRCPAWSHVRKVNPRNEDHNPAIPERLIFRRGYPFIEPGPDGRARSGLLFVCFQRDVATGFEAIKRDFAGARNFPVPGARPFTPRERDIRHWGGRFSVAELHALTADQRAALGLGNPDDFADALANAADPRAQETGPEGLAGPSENGISPTGESLAIVALGGGYYFVPPIPDKDLARIGQQFF